MGSRKPSAAARAKAKRAARRGVIRGGDPGRITNAAAAAAPTVRGPQLALIPSSKNAAVRKEGRLRPVVSIRLEPKTLNALDDIALARPYGWDKRPWPRTMLIEEALREYIAAHGGKKVSR